MGPHPQEGGSSGLPQPAAPHPRGVHSQPRPLCAPSPGRHGAPTVWQVSTRPRSSRGGCREPLCRLVAQRTGSSSPGCGWALSAAIWWPWEAHNTLHTCSRASDHPPEYKGWCRIKQILEEISGLAVSPSFPNISLGCSEQGRQAPWEAGTQDPHFRPSAALATFSYRRGRERGTPLLCLSCRGPSPPAAWL